MSSPAPKVTPTDDYSWADYMIYMEAGADIVSPPSPQAVPAAPAPPTIATGLLISIVVAVSAILVSELPVWPFTLANGRHPIDSAGLAILLGLIIGNAITLPSYFRSGIKFAVKRVLPLGIILLGARLNMTDLMRVGLAGMLLSAVQIMLAIGALVLLGRRMKLGRKIAMLLGVGTGICGGSAILATAPAIEAEEEDVVFSVAVVSLLGTFAMFMFPLIGHLLDLSPRVFGLWSGLTLHQTPQVVAAGFSYGAEAGEIATIVKLARVCLLAPVVFVLGLMYARSKSDSSSTGSTGKHKISYRSLVPTFVIGLFALVALRTMGLLPDLTIQLHKDSIFGAKGGTVNTAELLRNLSTLLIVISMAAAGLETKLSVLKKIGHAPLIAATIGFLFCTCIMLALLYFVPI